MQGGKILFNANETLRSVLEGFTIRNGGPSNGAIDGQRSEASIRNCIVSGSRTEGISIDYGRLVVADCVIEDNEQAGIGAYQSHVAVRRCRMRGNGSTAVGFSDSGGIIADCVVTGNGYGYGTFSRLAIDIVNNPGTPSTAISHCTVIDNCPTPFVGMAGGLRYSRSGPLTVTNSIFWNNGTEILANGGAVVRYSNIAGGYTGEGNINAEPRFAPGGSWKGRLLPDSPCINAGDPAADYTGQADVAGRPRVSYGRTDMGACEFNGTYDLQGDGVMDLGDWAVFAGRWLEAACGPDNMWCSWCDFDCDGSVLLDDLVPMLDNWLDNTAVTATAWWRFEEAAGGPRK